MSSWVLLGDEGDVFVVLGCPTLFSAKTLCVVDLSNLGRVGNGIQEAGSVS